MTHIIVNPQPPGQTVVTPAKPARPIEIEGSGRIPPGGTAGQALVKSSDSDFATEWGAAEASWGGIVGTLTDQTDLVAALGLKADTSALADVALSGDYADLSGLPTLGTAAAAATTDFATAAQGALAATALQPGAVIPWTDVAGKPAFAAIATSGSASDLSAGTVPAARFDDTSHGSRAGGSLHANAVASGAAGFMTGADKAKLDGIASGAQVNVPTDLGYTASTRELTSSTGADVTLPIATETTPGLARRVEKGPTRYYAFDDFTATVVTGNQTVGDWTSQSSGTGAGQSNASHGYTVGAGWVAFNTGSTTSGRTARTLSIAALYLGAGPAVYRAVGLTGPLSTSVERYTLRIGFIDSVSGESTDGVFFRYVDNVNSGRWQAVHRRAGVETAADTGITYATATVYRFEIETDEINKQSVFKIDGVTVATITTNFPDNGLTGAGVLVTKGLGTTSVAAITMDYQSVEQILVGRL